MSVEYFQSFIERHPVFLPQSTPIYSNTAFRILSYAIEAIANDSFENIMKRSFIEPLSLAHTTYRKPKNSLGVIPEGDSNWAYDLGDETP
jgi:CubicO group peptidase (beta-lactamase class C family)